MSYEIFSPFSIGWCEASLLRWVIGDNVWGLGANIHTPLPLPSPEPANLTSLDIQKHYRMTWSPGEFPRGGRIVKGHTTTPPSVREACVRTSANEEPLLTYLLTQSRNTQPKLQPTNISALSHCLSNKWSMNNFLLSLQDFMRHEECASLLQTITLSFFLWRV